MEKQTEIEKMNTNRNLFFMTLPIFVEMLLQLLVGNIDQMMVSRVSQQSVASIVNANQIMNVIIFILSLATTAVTVILTQHIGSGNERNVSRTCMVSILFILFCSFVTTVGLFLFQPLIYRGLRVQAEIYEESTRYLLIVGSFIMVQGLFLTFSAINRAFVLMKQAMVVSVLMNLLNIAGNAILINGWFGFPQLGAIGAAISTNFSKLVGLLMMVYLFRTRTHVKLRFSLLKPFPVQILKSLCMLAIPTGIESTSYNLSQICILSIINTFGTMVTVTKGYCSIFANVDYVYSMALASGAQVILGYLIGACRTDLIQKRVNSTLKVALAVCVGMAFLMYLGGDYVFLIFTDNPEIISLGKRILFLEIFLEIGRAVNIVMTRSLIAVGEARMTMVVGVVFHWAVSFAGAWLLGSVWGLGLEGVWIAMAADECIRGLIYVIEFRKGKWKNNFKAQDGAIEEA